MKIKIVITFLLLMIVTTLDADNTFKTGEIIEKVVCQSNAEQSYALYLPTGYDKDKYWPILYAFEPAARGKLPVTLFKQAAEKYGYIVVGSNNARNGPGDPIRRAIWAVWRDTRARFSIDRRRIYATGFSGGARMASVFHVLTGKTCAGIIGCGAGMSPAPATLEDIKPAAWYAIVGTADFNYKEVTQLTESFDKAGIINHLDVPEMDHRRPPANVCARAIDWMEIQAMKKGTRKTDKTLADSLYQQALTRAHNLEQAGKIYYAAAGYETAGRLFQDLTDTAHAETKAAQLKGTAAYKKFQKEENERRQKEQAFISRFGRVIYRLEHPGKRRLNLKEAARELRIDELRKEAEKNDNIYAAGLAHRLLYDLNLRIGGKGDHYRREGNYDTAALFYELMVRTGLRLPFTYYNLACSYSLAKKKKKAIKNLERAIKEGFNLRSHMETDTDLDYIRNEKAFKTLLREMKGRGQTK